MPRKAQPIAVPKGEPYGARQQSARAQAALPLPAAGPPPVAGTAPAPAPGATPGGGGLAGAMADLQGMAPLGPLQGGNDHMLSNDPRPITTMPPDQSQTPLNVIRFLPALEAAAAAPGSSWATRQMVRRLRAGLPANVDMADPSLAGG